MFLAFYHDIVKMGTISGAAPGNAPGSFRVHKLNGGDKNIHCSYSCIVAASHYINVKGFYHILYLFIYLEVLFADRAVSGVE